MTRARRRFLLISILLATAGLYAPNLHHDFQYDDETKLESNLDLRDPLAYFRAFAIKGYSEHTTRLIPNLTFCLNSALQRATHGEGPFKLDPFGFNVANLVIHLVCVWLVYRLGRAVGRRRSDLPREAFIPLFGAALFAVHTLNSEAVNYCNARPNTLVTMFYLLALLNFLRAVETSPARLGIALRRWGLFAIAFLAALLSKEMALTVVVMVPLLLFWIEWDRYRRFLVPLLISYVVLAVLGIGVLFFTGTGTELARILDVGDSLTGHWAKYLLLNWLGQSRVVMAYFGLALLPLPRWLNANHEIGHLNEAIYPDGRFVGDGAVGILAAPVACFLILAAGIVTAIVFRRRARFATFFVLWQVIAHAPTSLVPRGEEMVEYRTYLPMVGMCLLLAWAVDRGLGALSRGWTSRRSAVLRATVVAVMLGALFTGTLVRNPVWRTKVGFWADIVQKSPGHFRSWLNYGKALEGAGRADEPPDVRRVREDRALAAYEQALAIKPGLWQGHNNRGYLLIKKGLFDEALKDLELALQNGSSPLTFINLALVYDRMGRFDRVIETLRTLTIRYPEFVDGHLNLGKYVLASGKPGDAVQSLKRALQLDPDIAIDALPLLAEAYRRTGAGSAAADLHARIALRPALFAPSFLSLGRLILLLGSADDAISPLEQAAVYDAALAPEAAVSIAHAHMNGGRARDAERILRDAVGRYPTIAALQAALGRLLRYCDRPKEAVAPLEDAIRLAPGLFGDLAPDLADAHLRAGYPAESVRVLEEFVRRFPDDFPAQYDLGVLYLRVMNDRAKAAPHLRRAIEIKPDHPQAKEAKRLLGE